MALDIDEDGVRDELFLLHGDSPRRKGPVSLSRIVLVVKGWSNEPQQPEAANFILTLAKRVQEGGDLSGDGFGHRALLLAMLPFR